MTDRFLKWLLKWSVLCFLVFTLGVMAGKLLQRIDMYPEMWSR